MAILLDISSSLLLLYFFPTVLVQHKHFLCVLSHPTIRELETLRSDQKTKTGNFAWSFCPTNLSIVLSANLQDWHSDKYKAIWIPLSCESPFQDEIYILYWRTLPDIYCIIILFLFQYLLEDVALEPARLNKIPLQVWNSTLLHGTLLVH